MKKLIVIFMLGFSGVLYADHFFNSGTSYYIHKNYAKSKEMFLKSAEATDSGDAYYFLGEIEKLQENYDQALKYYSIAVTKKSISQKYLRNAYWSLLVIAEQRGDQETVIKTCKNMWIRTRDGGAKKRIEDTINKYLWSDNEAAVEKYKAGLELKTKGDSAGAEKLFREAVSASSTFLAPKVELGIAAYKKGDMNLASDYLGEIADKITFYAEIQLIMGDISMRRQEWDKGKIHFDRVFEFGLLDSSTEYIALLKRAKCLYKTGHRKESQEDLRRALKINSKSLSALLLLASINIDENDLAEAMVNLKQAEKIDPNDPFVLFSIGGIHYKNRDKKFADYFERLYDVETKRKQGGLKYSKAYVLLIKHYYETKSFQRAADMYQSIPKNYYNYDLTLMAARSHYQLKNYDRAIALFETLSLKDADQFTLCRAYALHGSRAKAKDLLMNRYSNRELIRSAEKDQILSPILKEVEKEMAARKPEPPKEEKKAPEKKPVETKPEPVKEKETETIDKKDSDSGGIDIIEEITT